MRQISSSGGHFAMGENAAEFQMKLPDSTPDDG